MAPTTSTESVAAEMVAQAIDNLRAEESYADMLAHPESVADAPDLFGVLDELTDEQIAALEASLPKCPECGADIDTVHFIAHEDHRFFSEISSSGGTYRSFDRVIETGRPLRGEVNCYSRNYEMIDREPNLAWRIEGGKRVDLGIEVKCESGHTWNEPRLKVRRRSGDDTDWEVLP